MVQSTKTSSSSTYNKTSILHKTINHKEKSIKSTYYKPEYAIANMKYRLVPNYCILKRILKETQSLLGPNLWFPKHVLDVGMGIGSASAATLDFFFEMQQIQKEKQKHYPYKESTYQGIEWIHGIEPSQSMKDAASILLKSVIDGHDEIRNDELEKTFDPLQRNKIRFTMDHGIVPTAFKSSSSSSSTTTTKPDTDTTMGISSTSSTNQSFDLALCSYTLCEIPSVPAVLSMSAMIWEKLRPGGVAIFVEPGTPDGFNALRSVRNMLLDCCPPSENVHKDKEDDKEDADDNALLSEEECHVIAPCTHNGTCPMVRHQRNFKKRNSEGHDVEEEEGDDDDDLLSMDQEEWDNNDDDDDEEDDDGEEDESVEFNNVWEKKNEHDTHANETTSTSATTSSDTTPQAHAFETAFCSFVHAMPGKEQGNQGEKFSYLVVQKRIRGEDVKTKEMDKKYNPFHNVNLVELLKESMDRKDVVASFRKSNDDTSSNNSNSYQYLEKAIQVEDEYLDSTLDGLGLELVRGENRSHWGRIVRAPIKKKGHVIIDYCSNIKSNRIDMNENDVNENDPENVGVIHRLMVTKSQSSKSAPGMYSSSRKARWGGFWPDVK
jgi:ribosomal protein RSM22 (predicted rRNA methylase)